MMSVASSPPRRVEFRPTRTDPDRIVAPRAKRYSGTLSSKIPTWGGRPAVNSRSQVARADISATTSAQVQHSPSNTKTGLVSLARASTTSAAVAKASRGNGLQLEVLLEPLSPVLPTDATRLVSAEGAGKVGRILVDPDGPGPDSASHLEPVGLIARPYGTGQSILRFVGDAHRLLLAVVRDDHHYRAEDLLTGDPHGILDGGKDGRTHVAAPAQAVGFAGTAGHHPGTLVDPERDVARNPVLMASRDHRPDLGGLLDWAAHEQAPGHLTQGIGDRVVAMSGGEHPGLGGARLPAVHERGETQPGGDPGQIGVVQNDRDRKSVV